MEEWYKNREDGGDDVAKWVGFQLLTLSHADCEGDFNASPHEDLDRYIQTTSTFYYIPPNLTTILYFFFYLLFNCLLHFVF